MCPAVAKLVVERAICLQQMGRVQSSAEARTTAILDVQNVWEVFSKGKQPKKFGQSIQKARPSLDCKAAHPAAEWAIKPVSY